MEIKQLQHFLKIAEAGSLTRAAGMLGLTQAALSRQVALLEAELDVELFRRNGRGLVLTDAGKRLLEQAHLILRQVAQAQRYVKGVNGPVQGTLALGLPPSLARTMVIPLIEAFQASLPQASMRSVDGLSLNLIELVAGGKLDCAVVYNTGRNETVNLVTLARENLYLVSGYARAPHGEALGASVTLEDIAPLPIVAAGQQNAIHIALIQALAALGKTPNVVHEIANMNAILDLVRKGHGYAIIPASGVHSCIGDREIRLHRIRKPALYCNLSVALPMETPGDPLTAATLELLKKVVPAHLKSFQSDVENAIRFFAKQ